MDRFARGTKVRISTIFYDATGGIAQPTSANIVFSYANAASGSYWPLDGEDRLTSTSSLASVSTTLGTWATTWNSAVASTGFVYWTAYPSTLVTAVNFGQFELTGNPSGFPAIPSTGG
jgi:hypothetical protein